MNLEFRKPIINDKETLQKLFEKSDNINSEVAFGTSYLWSDAYKIEICLQNSMLFKKINSNEISYELPQGAKTKSDFKEAINLLKEDFFRYNGNFFKFTNLVSSEAELLQEAMPGCFEYELSRDDCEYIYALHDLANLPGKKYHSKRNHISKFKKLYSASYLPISQSNKEECFDFFRQWFEINYPLIPCETIKEYGAVKKAFENYRSLGLMGGALKVGKKIIACTVAENINGKALLIHFEKALPDFKGAYSVINQEFCKSQEGKYKFVNREEDMGIAGLRKSKLSYKPKILLKKYNAVWKG